jgi:hypothetical protein
VTFARGGHIRWRECAWRIRWGEFSGGGEAHE